MYDYTETEKDMRMLKNKYANVNVFTIGRSIKGRELYTVRLGKGKKEVYYNGAHHGMEWITSQLLMKFIFDVCYCNEHGIRLRGRRLNEMLAEYSIYITPMVNPDGVELSKTHDGWQANARGVDLNHNYDAMWRRGKLEIARQGISAPGPTKYSGPYPESEPESRAVADFTRKRKFSYVVALHSQGEVIYWKYGMSLPDGSAELAKRMSKSSGYMLDEAKGTDSYSGYKDWFIKSFNRPGFTIEVGKGKNPLSVHQLPKIYNNILEILLPISV